MFKPVHLYMFRLVALLVISLIAMAPFVFEFAATTALTLTPFALIVALVVIALLEQTLLHRVDWQKTTPIKAHKIHIKPIRAHRHATCRLLGLPCAA